MFEIERKFRLNPTEVAGVRAKLESTYGKGKKLIQHDELFLFKKASYDEHVTGEGVLRIRRANNKNYFTYKHTVLETGNRVEHETEIADPEALREAILAMGWQSVIQIEKVRLHYHLKDVSFELDAVKGLGAYLEIELLSKEDSDAEARIIAMAESLGVAADRIERRSYGKLLAEKLHD